jgi:hypothetical protein
MYARAQPVHHVYMAAHAHGVIICMLDRSYIVYLQIGASICTWHGDHSYGITHSV